MYLRYVKAVCHVCVCVCVCVCEGRGVQNTLYSVRNDVRYSTYLRYVKAVYVLCVKGYKVHSVICVM